MNQSEAGTKPLPSAGKRVVPSYKSAISFLYVSRVLGNNEFKSIDN